MVPGLRPEDITLGSGPVAARIQLAEPHGREHIAQLDIPGGDTPTFRADAALTLPPGKAVGRGVRPSHPKLFDATTRTRIAASFAAPAQVAAA